MGRSETFEHTADLGLRIFATDLPDLFRTAGEALFDVIVANRSDVRVVETELVSLTAESIADLLVQWLNELIFRCET
ncbi:MAG TPA: archease, partial [Isosphaeraceae bacterium]|nr:archease [Isosphaeraceae bacterium]